MIEPDGWFACAVHHAVWHEFGFAAEFARLEHDGVLEPVETVESAYYASSSGTDGRLCVSRRR